MISPSRLTRYRRAIAKLPAGTLTRSDVINDTFLIKREEHLAVYYAPLDAINYGARVALVGLTPGWHQMQIAFEKFRDARRSRQTVADALDAAKTDASFAGMRKRLCAWLDELGVAELIAVESTSALFGDAHDRVHTTSLIRYPVFTGPEAQNYTGYKPRPERSPLLMSIITEVLLPELDRLPHALIVPMGRRVSAALDAAGVDRSRCLYGFPHPSGVNSHGPAQFAAGRRAMASVVAALCAERVAGVARRRSSSRSGPQHRCSRMS